MNATGTTTQSGKSGNGKTTSTSPTETNN
jgi:hypothetical protein